MYKAEKDTNGKIVFTEETYTVEGKEFKKIIEFYENGMRMVSGTTKNGKAIGVWTHYSQATGVPFGYQFFDFDGNKLGEEHLK
jgi:antitoxin component YwqK of YwqJK toxin-antitoxin module